MAQAVTVGSGDTMIGLLKQHRGLKDHEAYLWLDKLRKINPHISDLNAVYPQERVLLPDSPADTVSEAVIWQNAFNRIPPALIYNGKGNHTMYISLAGETIDEVARMMFADTPFFHLPLSTKRALLIHNNPFLRDHLTTNQVPPGTLLDVSPVRFSQMDHHFWNSQRPYITVAWDDLMDPTKQLVLYTGTDQALTLAELLKQLEQMGAAIGMEDAVTWTGYGVGGVSGYSASAQIALANAQTLAREIYAEAIAKFGEKAVLAKKSANLARMQQFLTTHPKYGQLMQSLRELPRHLLPKGRLVPAVNGGAANAAARHFRKTFSLPYDKWNSSRYLSTVGRQLNGKVSFFKGLGRHATWYVPAVIGIYNVATAPQEQKVKTVFEEGFGILAGALGTKLGVIAGIGIATVIGLGPFGWFVAVFICAGIAGMAFNAGGNWLGGKTYDFGNNVIGTIYHSPEQLLGAN